MWISPGCDFDVTLNQPVWVSPLIPFKSRCTWSTRRTAGLTATWTTLFLLYMTTITTITWQKILECIEFLVLYSEQESLSKPRLPGPRVHSTLVTWGMCCIILNPRPGRAREREPASLLLSSNSLCPFIPGPVYFLVQSVSFSPLISYANQR